MTDFKQEWTVESALKILQHPTVESKIWAEAVEWLMLYGPPEIKEMLSTASSYATSKEFPDLKPEGFTEDGDPVYSVSQVAKALRSNASASFAPSPPSAGALPPAFDVEKKTGSSP